MIVSRFSQIGLLAAAIAACHAPSTAQIEPMTAEDVAAAPDEWRQVEPDNLVMMETTKGRIILELLPEAAPRHVEHFRSYVRQGLYDDTAFHRVIKDFMAQGGDVEAVHGADKMLEPLEAEFTFRRNPTEFPIDTIGPADSASAGFYKGFPIRTQAQFLAEMSIDGQVETWIPHCPGVLSSARTDDPNSANAQFFLISKDGQHLDREYTAKGRVLEGLEVVQAIRLGPSPDGFPIANPDILQRAVMVSDMEPANQPRVYVQKTDTIAWQERRAAADQTRAKICTLPTVPAVVVE